MAETGRVNNLICTTCPFRTSIPVLYRLSPYFALLLAFLACGNPDLRQYLVSRSSGGDKSDKAEKVTLYDKNNLKIILEATDPEAIDEFAENLRIAAQQKYYRLPDLTYFRIRVLNKRDNAITLNLFSSVFKNELGTVFQPLGKTDYQKRFTSIAYERFPYDSLYSFYVVRSGDKKPEGDNIYIEKVLPEKAVEISADEEGYQLLPFEFFDPGARLYKFILVISPEEKIEKTFYYRTVRADEKTDL